MLIYTLRGHCSRHSTSYYLLEKTKINHFNKWAAGKRFSKCISMILFILIWQMMFYFCNVYFLFSNKIIKIFSIVTNFVSRGPKFWAEYHCNLPIPRQLTTLAIHLDWNAGLNCWMCPPFNGNIHQWNSRSLYAIAFTLLNQNVYEIHCSVFYRKCKKIEVACSKCLIISHINECANEKYPYYRPIFHR